jgi:glutaredoxin
MIPSIHLVRWYVFVSLLSAVALQVVVVRKTSASNQLIHADPDQRCLKLELFVRSDSALCHKAIEYAQKLVERREGICLEVVDTLANQESLDRYRQLVRRFRVAKPSVPIFYACNRLKTGFSSEAKSGPVIDDLFAIHAYIRPTCQHCRDAKRFLTALSQRWKGIQLIFHDVDREAGATQEMTLLASRHGITSAAFPVVYVCGRVISGYRTDATTGRQIEDLLIKASVTKADERHTAQDENAHAHSLQFRVWMAASIVSIVNGAAAGELIDGPSESEIPQALPDAAPPLDEDDSLSEDVYTAPPEAPEGVDIPWIGYVRVREWGLPAFTLLIGLIDGFNPCAMWVLVFLLSVLVNIRDRRKIAAIAGTFVVVSGLAYFTFMAAWLNLFMLVGIARPLQIALGTLAVLIGLINVKDFFSFKKGVTLSIPESAKPGIYSRVRRIVTTDYISVAIGLSVILAVVVNVVELMCTAGLPAVYTQILTLQQLPAWKNYLYLGLYNVGYMFDDSLMVIIFVVTLSHRKMRQVEGRWLKLISGAVVLVLGLAMLFRPDWLQW